MIKLSPDDEALIKQSTQAVHKASEAVLAAKDTEALRNSLYPLSEHVTRAYALVADVEDRTRTRELSKLRIPA